MRKRTKLLLAVAVLLVATGAGLWKALASAPSSGTPTALSTYGTVVIESAAAPGFLSSGTQPTVNVYIFSTSGPFYVEKVNAWDSFSSKPQYVTLGDVYYDSGPIGNIIYPACDVVIPAVPPSSLISYVENFGDIISVTPHTMTDPTGARAVSAAGAIEFQLYYNGAPNCSNPLGNFPSGFTTVFEATVLAPTAATVSICVNEGSTPLTHCGGG